MRHGTLQAIFGLVLFLGLGFSIQAENLVFTLAGEGQTGEQVVRKYSHPIFYEDRFVLSLEENNWQPENESQQILSDWDMRSHYFILYPIRPYPADELQVYGRILLQQERFLIFKTPHGILNDFKLFHNFKIVKIFQEKIITKTPAPLPLTDDTQFNPVIQQLVNNVSADSIWDYISQLQSLERYTNNSGAIVSSEHLKNFYLALGYDTVYYHQWQSGAIPNVVAVRYGKEYPDEIYLVGSHYDVYTNGAPGADDNGSGTAAVMEMARVLAGLDYKRTIKFVNFSGEELGLLGSAAYATRAVQQGENILGMINMDMIAYVAPGDPLDVDVVKNSASQDLFNAYTAATQQYVPSLPVVIGSLPFGASSDHASFWNKGFKAIFPFEDSNQYSPYIHSSQDVLGLSANNQTLARLGTASVVATLVTLSEIAETRVSGTVYSAQSLDPLPQAIVYFNADSVFSNSQGFYQTPALQPGVYDFLYKAPGFLVDSFQVSLAQYQVENRDVYLLPTGSQRPFVHLAQISIDDDNSGASSGNANGIADAGEIIEVSGNFMNTGNFAASNVLGLASSSNPWITILYDSLKIDSIGTGGSANSANSLVIQLHPDTPANTPAQILLNLTYQGYSGTSNFEIMIHNRGQFLIVDDDDNNGGLQVYKSVLDSLGISYDLGTPDTPSSEMVLYQHLIWFCGEDWSNTLTSGDQQKLTDYLNQGGKLLLSGVDIGYEINNDPFYTNYLKANYIGDGPTSTTTMAYGITGDPISGMFSSGMSINDNYVDQIQPIGGAEKIFTYQYNSNSFNCGLKYSGAYQLVYLTFAFENIPSATDRLDLMNNIIVWMGIVTDLQPGPEVTVNRFELWQNYPNPFNAETNIEFSIPGKGLVTLDVFDILGRKVKTLVKEELNSGSYKLHWDGRNETGETISSGFYFYRLMQGQERRIRKLLMLK